MFSIKIGDKFQCLDRGTYRLYGAIYTVTGIDYQNRRVRLVVEGVSESEVKSDTLFDAIEGGESWKRYWNPAGGMNTYTVLDLTTSQWTTVNADSAAKALDEYCKNLQPDSKTEKVAVLCPGRFAVYYNVRRTTTFTHEKID